MTQPPGPPAETLEGVVGPIPEPRQIEVSSKEKRALQKEDTARWLAVSVVGIFGVTVFTLTGYGITDSSGATELAPIILPAVTGPAGVALGYYFAGKE